MAWGSSSAVNIYQNPDMQLGNYNKDTQKLLQDPWITTLNQIQGAKAMSPYAQNLASGNITLAEALKRAQTSPSMENALFTSPVSASAAAAQQVQDNPLYAGMFGAGGIQEGRQNAEKDLMSRGYSLQPEDYEAYGQASNNIARQYGNYENSLAHALASRGLSGGGGSSAVAFSGLQGNKLEQLASSQRQIANDRMQMNLQRLNAMQGAVNQGNVLAQNALNQQVNTNFKGSQAYQDQLKAALGVADQANASLSEAWKQEQESGFSPGKVLGGAIAGGLGGALGAATGGAATGALGALGNAGKGLAQSAGNWFTRQSNQANPNFMGPRY